MALREYRNEKPQLGYSWGIVINRATSYSPTQLPVQYHRGCEA